MTGRALGNRWGHWVTGGGLGTGRALDDRWGHWVTGGGLGDMWGTE